MGQPQSSHVSYHSKTTSESMRESVRGRKSVSSCKMYKPAPYGLRASIVSDTSMPEFEFTEHDHSSVGENVEEEDCFSEIGEEGESLDDDESEYSDDEADEEWVERLQILQDANQMKLFAEFFLHPEKPIEGNRACQTRCYFDRPSAPEPLSLDEVEEQALIQKDLHNLKKAAIDYLHPELPVVTDPCASARCFFSRPSAPTGDETDWNERDLILQDAQNLKQYSDYFLHPEKAIAQNFMAQTRCYVDRFSAGDETTDDTEEHQRILQDATRLKILAVDYLHPENPVTVKDPTVFARCFYDRPDAPQQESVEDMHERRLVLNDAKQLKTLAVDYMHPELSVAVKGPTVFARCFYDRPQQESAEDMEERQRILHEAKQLQTLAVDYMHPELQVTVKDPTVFARSFYDRLSAIQQDFVEDMEERQSILHEAKQLKTLAVDYMHPELPVTVKDPTVFARCFYDRPSAAQQESVEDMEERQRIIDEAKQLKALAVDYLHPELPVTVKDPTVFARCFYDRPSAPQQESAEDMEERQRIMEEAKQLKNYAADYLHPERPVVVNDWCVSARCFFDRPSAHQQQETVDVEERQRIMDDVHVLRRLAMDYLHPENKVKTSDGSACGRNFFSRPSAIGHRQMIHTFPPHADDEYSDHHVDHFGLDEEMDMFSDMRHELYVPDGPSNCKQDRSDAESNLSRSPSSVMLFSGESIYD